MRVTVSVAQEQLPVTFKIRVQHHVQQSALARYRQLGYARNGSWQQPSIPDQAQPARPFRHQLLTVWQKCQAPGVFKVLGHRHQLESGQTGCMDRTGGQRYGQGKQPESQSYPEMVMVHRGILRSLG